MAARGADSQDAQPREQGAPRWRGTLDSARSGIQRSSDVLTDATADVTDATARGLRRSGDAIADATVDAAEVAKRGVQRSSAAVADATSDVAGTTKRRAMRASEVLSGADIRAFDEFIEAVTRVVVGLHLDIANSNERMTRVEQEAAEHARRAAELAGRLELLERPGANQLARDDELAPRGTP